MKQKVNYEAAVQQLEDIVKRMETGQMDLDTLSTELKTAQQLIALCKDRLTKTDADIKTLLGEEDDKA